MQNERQAQTLHALNKSELYTVLLAFHLYCIPLTLGLMLLHSGDFFSISFLSPTQQKLKKRVLTNF